MDEVENHIYQFEGVQREILLYLYEIFVTELLLESKLRYKMPFYKHFSWIIYTIPKKDNAIELCFVNGQRMSNNHGLLQANKRKQIAGITLHSIKDIDKQLLYEIIQEALLINETIYNLRNGK